jgi:hypothetical protein
MDIRTIRRKCTSYTSVDDMLIDIAKLVANVHAVFQPDAPVCLLVPGEK